MANLYRRVSFLVYALPLASLIARGADPAEKIELKKIVLYNSGVGYFEHAGQIDGNGRVDLQLAADGVNDLLKSVVVEDQGGRVATVTFEPRRPVGELLKSFAVDLASNPTLGDLLHQLRGHEVQLDAPQPIEGTIVGVELRPTKVGETQVLDVEVLNLRTATGLRSVPLASIVETRFPDAKLNEDFARALGVLARRRSTEKKSVSVDFRGEGRRIVRLGYIQESPVWKTSYRLVIKPEGAPLLQGWAIVENTTDFDWQDVDLTLVSGRPVSFAMNLDQPLFAARPLVEPESFAKLKPKTYEQDLASREAAFRRSARGGQGQSTRLGGMGAGMGGGMGGMGFGGGSFGGGGGTLPAGDGKAKTEPLDPTKSVVAAAQAEEVGELFRYEIEAPVTLARQHSAMLPIVNGPVRGEKIAIYNAEVHVKHPLDGFRLINATDLHLMAGPITVFDEGAYAGDARVEDIPPGGERLISYALDLDTEVVGEFVGSQPALTVAKISGGSLTVRRRTLRKTHFTIKNSGKAEKTVLIEQPIGDGWRLRQPKEPTEKTRNLYRFAVKAPPGEPQRLDVVEDSLTDERVLISNLEEQTLKLYGSARAASGKVREALCAVLQRRVALGEIERQMGDVEKQLSSLAADQSRVRQNMTQLDRGSDLYKQYVAGLAEQEQEILRLRQEFAEHTAKRKSLVKEFDEFVAGLEVQ